MALYFPIIANTCDSFLVFRYPVLCYFSFWSEPLFCVYPLVSSKHCFYVRLCLCACVCVHHSNVLNILGFDPKITQTSTEARTDQGSPEEKWKWRKMCLSAIFLYPQGKYAAKFIFVAHQTLCSKRIWLLCKCLRVSSTLGSFVWWRSNLGNDVKVAERKWSVVLSRWDRTTKAPLTLVSCFFSHCRQTAAFSSCNKQVFFTLNGLFTHSAFDDQWKLCVFAQGHCTIEWLWFLEM